MEQTKNTKLNKKRHQRSMFQTKEQDKTLEEQVSDVEIGSLPEKVSTIMIVDDPRSQKKNGGRDGEENKCLTKR